MKVTLLTPVQSGTDKHDAGDVVDLPKAAAQQLIDCGAAVLFDAEAAKAAKAEAAAKAQAEAEAQALAEARALADALAAAPQADKPAA
jgi:ribosomal protein L9